MLIPAVFIATYTTFGPIAQDDTALYIADRGSIVRVDKNNSSHRMTLTAVPTTRRIAAIDVDGDRVYYATAPSADCRAYPLFPPDTLYVGFNCLLTDIDDSHELRSVSATGGDEQVVSTSAGVTEIAHDDKRLYWIVPSYGIYPLSGRLLGRNKTTGLLDLDVSSLAVSSVLDGHPFVVADDALYVVNGTRLQRVSKGSRALKDVAAVDVDSSVALADTTVYFVQGGTIRSLDTRSGTLGVAGVPLARIGVPVAQSVAGAAPGYVLAVQESGFSNEAIFGWTLSDLCTGDSTMLGSMSASVFKSYFVPPLTVPPLAIDSSGVFVGDRRAVAFPAPAGACGRRRAAAH